MGQGTDHSQAYRLTGRSFDGVAYSTVVTDRSLEDMLHIVRRTLEQDGVAAIELTEHPSHRLVIAVERDRATRLRPVSERATGRRSTATSQTSVTVRSSPVSSTGCGTRRV